ncbi:MAG: hypothetical protein ACRCZF_04275, partial [Gemmataceae bacterium]
MRNCACVFSLILMTAVTSAQSPATFDDRSLPGPNSFQNGAGLNPAGAFQSGSATFNNDYNPMFQSWSGWSYSNVTNITTAGFG